jgi:hypothetical protein
MNLRALALLLLLASLPAGCNATPPAPGPTDGSSPQTFLTGVVSDARGEPLTGARVEILSGSPAGLSTTTDSTGSFSLKGTFFAGMRVRASLDGYAETIVSLTGWWADDRSMGFTLSALPGLPGDSPVTAVFQAGDEFTLTLVAGDGCTDIPPEFRTRTYEVTLAAGSGGQCCRAVASTRGREFLGILDGVWIGMEGEAIRFLLQEEGFPYFAERVAPDAYLSVNRDAWASGASRGSVIVASGAGEMSYCEGVAFPPPGYWDTWNPNCPGPASRVAICKFSKLILAPK